MLKPATPENIQEACDLLRAGKLVALPTETVYGLAADAFNQAAVSNIFAAKGRPGYDPLIVHLADYTKLSRVAVIEEPRTAARLTKLCSLWPGPLSLVLKRRPELPAIVSANLDTVAVRVPAHPVMQQVLQQSGLALACPSANPFSYVSPTCAQHVQDQLADKVDLILDAGNCRIGIESSVLSIVDEEPTLLRPGALSREQLEQVLGERLRMPSRSETVGNLNAQSMPSPGMLDKHYAPRTPLALAKQAAALALPARVGRITFGPPATKEDYSPYASVKILSESGSLEEIGQKLFAAIRELDQLDLDLILLDSCPEEGLGLAIMDRLRRACSRI